MKLRITSRPTAFTLIELLIVVAIIAILAAIAVPNFLEAQTRSKVSRVKSDMRTLATAIEAYQVDNNRYIPTYHGDRGDISEEQAKAITNSANGNVYDYIDFCGQRLTTPIAYLTAIPHPSPFQVQEEWYKLRGAFFAKRAARPTLPTSLYDDWWGFSPAFNHKNVPWFLMDGGPDKLWWQEDKNGVAVGMYEVVTPYDPTNGTVSAGNIWWLGGGGN